MGKEGAIWFGLTRLVPELRMSFEKKFNISQLCVVQGVTSGHQSPSDRQVCFSKLQLTNSTIVIIFKIIVCAIVIIKIIIIIGFIRFFG